jgi:hypothetical protein
MNNDIYQNFVKRFKVALTNCSVYFPQHPIFSQSVNDFKKDINLIAQDESFLLIKIKPKALIINGKNLEERSLYEDLATFFHRRKVKSIKIKKEITNKELSKFLVNVSSSENNILTRGGIKKILKEKQVKNIEIEELDYSQLIKGAGKEVKDIWAYLLGSEDFDNVKNKEQFKSLSLNLKPQDLANLLSKLLQSYKEFNSASFKLFSALVSPDTHKAAADQLGKEVKKGKSKFNLDRINNLLASLDDQKIVPIYQKNLLLDNSIGTSKKKFSIDYDHLHQNYRLLLLDLFFYETNQSRLDLILKKILLEIEGNLSENIEFINQFAKIYIEKTTNAKSKEFINTVKKVWSQAEKNIFKTDDFRNFIFLTKVLDTTTLDVYFYLDKIEEKQFNPLVLRLFFKFFPKQINKLHEKIKDKRKDSNFMKKIITDLKLSNHFAALDLLKCLFNSVPISVKIEILDIVKNYSQCDQNFILPLVNSQSFHIRKKSVEIAIKFPQLHKQIAQKLFSLSNYFGFNSKIILENLEIINQNYISQARPFLDKLTRMNFFWNRQIRKKAKQVIKEHSQNG